MIEMAGWIAPAATMIAAMMTAANLGARVTGWGFVLFSVGAVAWILVALGSGQQNLLWSNAFLLLVDLVVIWRWLGRQARYDAGADAAAAMSSEGVVPTLFAVSTLSGKDVRGGQGGVIGHVVDAMAVCGTGAIAYLVVRQGGIGGVGESLHALEFAEIRIGDDAIDTALDHTALENRPSLDPERWPATVAAALSRQGAVPRTV